MAQFCRCNAADPTATDFCCRAAPGDYAGGAVRRHNIPALGRRGADSRVSALWLETIRTSLNGSSSAVQLSAAVLAAEKPAAVDTSAQCRRWSTQGNRLGSGGSHGTPLDCSCARVSVDVLEELDPFLEPVLTAPASLLGHCGDFTPFHIEETARAPTRRYRRPKMSLSSN